MASGDPQHTVVVTAVWAAAVAAVFAEAVGAKALVDLFALNRRQVILLVDTSGRLVGPYLRGDRLEKHATGLGVAHWSWVIQVLPRHHVSGQRRRLLVPAVKCLFDLYRRHRDVIL